MWYIVSLTAADLKAPGLVQAVLPHGRVHVYTLEPYWCVASVRSAKGGLPSFTYMLTWSNLVCLGFSFDCWAADLVAPGLGQVVVPLGEVHISSPVPVLCAVCLSSVISQPE